jgi:hypothetical protein
MSSIPSSPSRQQLESVEIYTRLLDEARVRIISSESVLNGRNALEAPLAVEFGYLQLRMLCEVVALSCLVAHGDINETRTNKFQKEYAADNIIKKLEPLHANFFPRPIELQSSPGRHHAEYITEGFLTKSELLSLYHECGDRLHRGSLAKFRSSAPKAHAADLEKLRSLGKKFAVLLNTHHVASQNNESHFVCFLSHEQTKGKSYVVLAQSPLPG